MFTRQLGADFDFQGGRRAQRAYFDAVKDLLAPTFTGATLVRIPVLDRDPRAAAWRSAAAWLTAGRLRSRSGAPLSLRRRCWGCRRAR